MVTDHAPNTGQLAHGQSLLGTKKPQMDRPFAALSDHLAKEYQLTLGFTILILILILICW
ncbi:hypothetical protein BH11ARM1_BH11ARM1_04580 [soil metagenome]